MDVPAQAKEANLTSLRHFVLFKPSADWMVPTSIERIIFFPQSTDSKANLFRKPLIDTPRNNFLLAIQAPHSPVELTHKIKHHTHHDYSRSR